MGYFNELPSPPEGFSWNGVSYLDRNGNRSTAFFVNNAWWCKNHYREQFWQASEFKELDVRDDFLVSVVVLRYCPLRKQGFETPKLPMFEELLEDTAAYRAALGYGYVGEYPPRLSNGDSVVNAEADGFRREWHRAKLKYELAESVLVEMRDTMDRKSADYQRLITLLKEVLPCIPT